jgi:hypothetical protein
MFFGHQQVPGTSDGVREVEGFGQVRPERGHFLFGPLNLDGGPPGDNT